MELTNELLLDMYRRMWRIRLFEDRVLDLYKKAQIVGSVHLYVGEEGVGVGTCSTLRPTDVIFSTHRGHGHCIAKGAQIKPMLAELMSKDTGYCRGRGGSMHIADVAQGVLGVNGIVGAGLPMAVGAGLSFKLQGKDDVSVCFFGDGASNQGTFHESMNLAAVWKLPVVFVNENNLYAISMPSSRSLPFPDVARRANSYGIPGVTVDGNDVVAVHEAVTAAVERARQGQGPSLIECKTYRWYGHWTGDPGNYRSEDEVEPWRARDPIARLRHRLISAGVLTEAGAEALVEEERAALEKAVEESQRDPAPDPSTLETDVYATPEIKDRIRGIIPASARTPLKMNGASEKTYAQALNEGIAELMEADPRVFFMGEDIGVMGGAFQATRGLHARFGAERVRDTPISESGFTGAGVGAALTGMRPIVELMFVDFTTVAMDQLVNQAAKIHFMFGGQSSVPMVLRSQGGAGANQAAQHSQSLEAWFVHVPGLVVVQPSTPADVKGLLKSAVECQDPVIFLEHKLVYPTKGPVPEGDYRIPLGVGEIKREGKDVTIFATSFMVLKALAAAEKLSQEEGIEAEVFDPRTLKPLDLELLLQSVRKTGRLVIVCEAARTGSYAESVAGVVAEKGFDLLDAPIKIVASADVPMPYASVLEDAAIPDPNKIAHAVLEVLGRGAAKPSAV